jgi:hypothetical protein
VGAYGWADAIETNGIRGQVLPIKSMLAPLIALFVTLSLKQASPYLDWKSTRFPELFLAWLKMKEN